MVEANLPAGVIRNNTAAVSGDIERIDTLTVEELAKLWRAYSTKQKLLANDVGRRLENFFWRIWSSEQVRTTIRGTQIAVIFEDISQGNIIRTTPTSSPRHSRLYSVAYRPQETHRLSPDRGPRDEDEGPSDVPLQRPIPQQTPSSDTIVPRKNSGAAEHDPSRPAPILKKPGSEYSSSNKTARIQTPGWKSGEYDPDHDEPMSPGEVESQRQLAFSRFPAAGREVDHVVQEPDLSPTTAVGSFIESSSLTPAPLGSAKMARTGSGTGSTSGMRGKKKGSFVVASARKRPVISRRQSSQTTGPTSAKTTSPSLRATRRTSEEVDTTNGGILQRASRSNSSAYVPALELCVSRSHSPVSESPFRRTARDHQASESVATPENVHREAAGLLAPMSQWVALSNGGGSSTDMSRTLSASGTGMNAMVAKSTPASTSSSNLQVTGTMTPTEIGSSTPSKRSMFGRASSFITGKKRATFDVGPPETESAAASRRTSLEGNVEQQANLGSGFARSRSQSQLSGLLDQARKSDAQKRNKAQNQQR